MGSNVGAWDRWYRGLDKDDPQPYGDTTTYVIAERHLKRLKVEDWGCGKGWFRSVHVGRYVGVDGSHTPFADITADLVTYRSDPRPSGILLRHVLEHNHQWEQILGNAIASATRRLAIILFTPMSKTGGTVTLGSTRMGDVMVPDLSLPHERILAALSGWETDWSDYTTATQYGRERVYLARR